MTLAAKGRATHCTRIKYSADEKAKEKKNGLLTKAVVVDSTPCPICREPVGVLRPDKTTEKWSRLPCGHRFGSHCIKRWVNMTRSDFERPSCPICRGPASHSCGHPVLPVEATNLEGAAAGNGGCAEGEECGGGVYYQKVKMCSNNQEDKEDGDGLRHRDRIISTDCRLLLCEYCRTVSPHTRLRRVRRRRITLPYQFVKGCYRRVRYGRSTAWAMNQNDLYEMDPERQWQKWWDKQEPCGV